MNNRFEFFTSKQSRKYGMALVVLLVLMAGQVPVAFAAEGQLGLVGSFFQLLSAKPFLYLFIALAIGYLLGMVKIGPVSLGSTAGALISGIAFALIAFVAYDIKIQVPGLLSTVFLSMFMFAIGLRVGPQFFSGIARDGFGLIGFAVIVVVLNWIICFFGAKWAGLAPGYGAGLISGSFTVTAVIGVASSAVEGGAFTLPPGITGEQVFANIAAGYAISYILSSLGIILLIKYLPTMFGYDPIAEGKRATELYGGGKDSAPPPGSNEGFVMGHSPTDIRAYRVENPELIGARPMDLFNKYQVPVLRVTRGGEWMDVENNEPLQKGDVITVRADVERHITAGGGVGPEVSDPLSRNIDLEVAEIVVGKSEYAGQTLEQVGQQVGYGLTAKALFRGGQEFPVLPDEKLEVGDVIRIVGPTWCVEHAAKKLGGKIVRESITTEFMYVAIGMSIGYMIGLLSVTIAGIPFALGTSAGVMLMGIAISTLRTRNPTFGGPVSEGARSLLQDIGLNLFVVVLAARVGPLILDSFTGTTVIWLAGIGVLGALVPAFVAFLYGIYILKMNAVVAAGATAGGRNSTPAMRAIQDESQSFTPAIGYPVPYALSSALVLIGGYLAMVLA